MSYPSTVGGYKDFNTPVDSLADGNWILLRAIYSNTGKNVIVEGLRSTGWISIGTWTSTPNPPNGTWTSSPSVSFIFSGKLILIKKVPNDGGDPYAGLRGIGAPSAYASAEIFDGAPNPNAKVGIDTSTSTRIVGPTDDIPNAQQGYIILPDFTTDGTRYILLQSRGKFPVLGGTYNQWKQLDYTTSNPICFRGDSLVRCLDTNKNEEYDKLAKDVVKDDMVLSTTRGWVKVLNNIVTFNEKQFYLFKKGCLGENMPKEDFYATYGHPIMYKGTETIAGKIPEGEKVIMETAENVYSIMTEKRECIKINNLDVFTWEPNEWDEFKNKNNQFHFAQ
jgi:hypothetical protein